VNPALRQLVQLLAAIAVEDFLREREQDNSKHQREPNGSNSEEARVRLENRKENGKHPKC
jgi:hypothetical protein